VWRAGESYPIGTLVTRAGGEGMAQVATQEEPATPNSGWLLAVISGKGPQDG